MRSILAALLLTFLLAGCGAAPDTGDDDSGELTFATVDSYPVTIEGQAVFDVSEGDNEFGEYADANFGDVKVDGKTYMLYATGPVAQAGGLPLEGGRARITLSGKSEFDGYHEVSRIERL
jgi:hypothetical protein